MGVAYFYFIAAKAPVNVIYVDIGGNREAGVVIRLIDALLNHFSPRILVVKNEQLYGLAQKHLTR